MANEEHKQRLGARLRRLRIQAGLTQQQVAKHSGCSITTLAYWERGDHAYQPWRAPLIAAALGVPIASLFVDELVLAEVRVSDETLERVRKEGRSVASEAAGRIAAQLEPLIWQAATVPAVDVSPGARAAKKRRTRRQVLAGVRAANAAQAAARDRREIA